VILSRGTLSTKFSDVIALLDPDERMDACIHSRERHVVYMLARTDNVLDAVRRRAIAVPHHLQARPLS
jgi:hypothetical protein